jgi:dethiobiotin synthetase
MGIEHRSIGPVVFYKGFTRAYLANETESSEELISKIIHSVNEISHNKKLTIVDGVGYPSVGSICNISNADVAKALNCPVLLVGKAGVGDAVDSYNLNSRFFEYSDVTVLGGIFNKLPMEGFYSLENCKTAVTSYFTLWRNNHIAYGFLPSINNSINFENEITESFIKYVDIEKLIFDIWNYKVCIIF